MSNPNQTKIKKLRAVNLPSKVVLHCSATPDYPPHSSAFDIYGAADFRAWHLKKGWSDIGYHWVIRRTGVLENGRAENVVGAHVLGYNANTLGICMVGTRWFTKFQIPTLLNLYSDIYYRHKINYTEWYGHYELNGHKKDCPGVPMAMVRAMLKYYHEVVFPSDEVS